MADKLRWEIIDNTGAQAPVWNYTDANGNPATGATGEGMAANAVYTGLFANNSHFGKRKVKLTIALPGLQNEIDETDIELFFEKSGTNHPGNTGKPTNVHTPNWYYYWTLTSANSGIHEYQNGSRSSCDWVANSSGNGGSFVARIRNDACMGPGGNPQMLWGGARGIDFFAWVVRHEDQHRRDLTGFWPSGYDATLDSGDTDWLPDADEPTLERGRAYRSSTATTYPDAYGYHPGSTPLTGVLLNDIEDVCLRRQAAWTNGNANADDWAKPGMQHLTLNDPTN